MDAPNLARLSVLDGSQVRIAPVQVDVIEALLEVFSDWERVRGNATQ
jgi:hypothetical protein